MEKFERAKHLLIELKSIISEWEDLIGLKKTEYDELTNECQRKKRDKMEWDELIKSSSELQSVMENCMMDVCQYKNAARLWRERLENNLEVSSYESNYHFFMCFRGNHYANPLADRSSRITVIDAHNEIIEKKGYVWWAKFYHERFKDGKEIELEPFGESIKMDGFSQAALGIKQNLERRWEAGKEVYLYNYSPNPNLIQLFKCRVVDFYFGRLSIPYDGWKESEVPECSCFSRYYFIDEAKGNCVNCRKTGEERCLLRFPSNFWFKIDNIEQIEPPQDEFAKLINCFTNDTINLAIPILYPLLVYIKKSDISPGDLLFNKGFKTIHIITSNSSSIDRLEAYLNTDKIKVTSAVIEYQQCENTFKRLSSKGYVADLLIFESGQLRHLQDFNVSGNFDKRIEGKDCSTIITKISSWVSE